MNNQIVENIATTFHTTLSAQAIEDFGAILECKEYQKDDIILKQGQVNRYFYYVHQGMIRQFYYKKGKDVTEHFSYETNMAVCIESLYKNKPADLLMQAIEPTVIYKIPFTDWQKLCAKHYDLAKLYMRVVEALLLISQWKADSWRFESAHERYDRFSKEHPEVVRRAPVAYIASYLLMSPESLSRVRAGVY